MSYAVDESVCRFVAAREALVLSVYADKHNPAWGFGENDPSLQPGQSTTIEAAVAKLVVRLQAGAKWLEHLFGGAALPQQCINALNSLQYNIGTGSLADLHDLIVSVRAYADRPDNVSLRDAAAMQLMLAHPRGGSAPFNLSRRARECLVFLAGDYGDLTKLMFWDVGKNPRIDRPQAIDMPTFLKG